MLEFFFYKCHRTLNILCPLLPRIKNETDFLNFTDIKYLVTLNMSYRSKKNISNNLNQRTFLHSTKIQLPFNIFYKLTIILIIPISEIID